MRGAGDVGRGLRHVFAHPRLLVWVIAPAVVTLLVIAAVIWGVLWLAGWAGGLLRFLVVACLAVVGFLVFVSAAGLLAGPFCELLSEQVEEQVTGRPQPGFSLTGFVRGLVMSIAHALRRLLVSLVVLAMTFVLGAIIPVVGPILAIVVGGYFAATSAAYDCFDAVFSRRLWPYRRKLEFLAAHRGRTVGLGAAVTAMLLVPILNLFALGFGAAGATLAAIEIEGAPRRELER
jgi:CysZ protein